ncbi:hypothetical protein [Burkholderia territorii]|uniref:hypothetical protein n=1 Tax=Burkholderia territorii TaxID=1503055 RepID=UPI000B0EF1B9|nr:hypothetical protein [Burkholderia territorii]
MNKVSVAGVNISGSDLGGIGMVRVSRSPKPPRKPPNFNGPNGRPSGAPGRGGNVPHASADDIAKPPELPDPKPSQSLAIKSTLDHLSPPSGQPNSSDGSGHKISAEQVLQNNSTTASSDWPVERGIYTNPTTNEQYALHEIAHGNFVVPVAVKGGSVEVLNADTGERLGIVLGFDKKSGLWKPKNAKHSLASSTDAIKIFGEQVKNSWRPLVHFPPSARGDMNAYKYVGFLDENIRPLTVFQYHATKKQDLGPEQAEENLRLDDIKEHLAAQDNLVEGRDYIFDTYPEFEEMAKNYPKERTKSYQDYDNIMQNPDVRKNAQSALRSMVDADEDVKAYLRSRCPPVDEVKPKEKDYGEYSNKENRLVLVNINTRSPQKKWNPREFRHSTSSDAFMRDLIQVAHDAHAETSSGRLDIGFVGSEFTDTQKNFWKEYGDTKKVNVRFFNDMVAAGLNRTQQRAALFALTIQYKNTIYIGHQSGVNEDAQILRRTNVYSLSEYLGQGQVGLGRVEARPQVHNVRTVPLGLSEYSRQYGNFYSLRSNEFLTTEGLLAAVQIKLSLRSPHHRSLEDLWSDVSKKFGNEGKDVDERINIDNAPEEQVAEKLLQAIVDDIEKNPGLNVRKEITKNNNEHYYMEAIRLIVRRKRTGESRPSDAVKKYFESVIKVEFSRHDDGKSGNERHYQKTEAANQGLSPYTIGDDRAEGIKRKRKKGEDNDTKKVDAEDDYLSLLHKTGDEPDVSAPAEASHKSENGSSAATESALNNSFSRTDEATPTAQRLGS